LINFTISCNPPKATHQGSLRPMKRKDGKFFIGKQGGSRGKVAKDNLTTLFSPYAPKEPLEGALKLHVVWGYSWRKSEPKKNKVNGFKPCDTRPDCDNIVKMVKDVLTLLGFWNDDAQVAKLVFDKIWCDHPHITVQIKEMV